MKVKNCLQDAESWFTSCQLKKIGRVPDEGVKPRLMWTNRHCGDVCEYYNLAQTREMTEEEARSYKKSVSERRHLYYMRGKRRRRYREGSDRYYSERKDISSDARALAELFGGGNLVVYDLETTGLEPDENGIVEIAMMDKDGNTLYEGRIRPGDWIRWSRKASEINGIREGDVADMPGMEDERGAIQKILDGAEAVVGYNNQGFDDHFMVAEGFRLPAVNYDVMKAFTPIYGEWSDWFGDYKWQSLGTAAGYYGYSMGGKERHTALGDARATLFVAKSIISELETPEGE